MFRRIEPAPGGGRVRFEFEGRLLQTEPGTSLAAALLENGINAWRRALDGGERGPFCLMGACFECLAAIDGEPHRQACLIEVRDGMRVRRLPPGARS